MKGSAKSGNAIAAENVRAEAAKCVDCKLIKGFCGKHITKLLEYEPRADLPIPPPPSSPPPVEMTVETLQLESKKCTDCKLVKGLCGKHITKFLEFEKRTGQAIVPPPPSSPPPPPSPPSSPTPMSAEALRSDINKCMECKVVKGLCSRHITKLIDFEKRTGTPALAVTPAFAIYATPKTSSKSSKASELVKIWEEKKKQLKLAQEKLRQKKAQEKEKQKRASQQADQAWSSTISTSEQARKEKLQKDKTDREKKDQKDRDEGKLERMKKEEKNPPQPTPPKEKGRTGFKFLQFTRKKEHEEEEKELQDEGAIDAEEARLNAELAKMSKKVKNFTQPSPTSPSQSKPKPSAVSSPSSSINHRAAPAPAPAPPEAPQSVDDEYMLLMGITPHPVLSRMASSPHVGSVETLDSLDEQEYQAEMELRMLMEQEAALEAEVMRALQTK